MSNIKKIVSILLLLTVVFTLAACDTAGNVQCGEGTAYVDGQCVAPPNNDTTDPDPDPDPVVDCNVTPEHEDCIEEVDCELTPTHPDCEVVDNTPATAIELLGNYDFTDSDISSFVTEGNVTLTHDGNGFLIANVSSFTGDFYQDNFTLGNLYTEAGYTYTISFTAKTDIEGGRDVQFFLEDTDNFYNKYFLETETLSSEFQTFTYTYLSTTDNNDSKIGVFLGNMDNAQIGNIIIDDITVVKTEGLQGTAFEDLENTDFTSSDISAWTTEGNVTLSHDSSGYLVIDVSAFTGNFWQENMTYRDLIVESWTTYTVEVVIKADTEKEVILFAEDTDNGYTKYAEVTHTVTTEWTTITLTFKPIEDNADTTLGLFLSTETNAVIGQVMIDSITITAVPFN